MFAKAELTHLAARKAAARRKVAVARRQCVEAGRELEPTFERIDSMVDTWHKIAPFLQLGRTTIGEFFHRKKKHPGKNPVMEKVASVFRWVPLVMKTIRTVAQVRSES